MNLVEGLIGIYSTEERLLTYDHLLKTEDYEFGSDNYNLVEDAIFHDADLLIKNGIRFKSVEDSDTINHILFL